MHEENRELFCFMVGMQFGEYLAHLPPDDPRESILPGIIARHLNMQPSSADLACESHEVFHQCVDEAFNELGCCAAKIPSENYPSIYERCFFPRTQKSFLCKAHQKEVMAQIQPHPCKRHLRKKSIKKTNRKTTAPRAGEG